jgi:16S rRNA (cytidine1402-2'-O)-methyltransferase
MCEIFGDRLAVVARELTKLHESYHRDKLALLADFYQQALPPKGEIVILVSGMTANNDTFDTAKLTAMLREEMRATSLRDAVQTVSQISSQSRKIIYSLAIDLDKEN